LLRSVLITSLPWLSTCMRCRPNAFIAKATTQPASAFTLHRTSTPRHLLMVGAFAHPVRSSSSVITHPEANKNNRSGSDARAQRSDHFSHLSCWYPCSLGLPHPGPLRFHKRCGRGLRSTPEKPDPWWSRFFAQFASSPPVQVWLYGMDCLPVVMPTALPTTGLA